MEGGGSRPKAAGPSNPLPPPGFPPEWHPQSAGSLRSSSHDDMVGMVGRLDMGPSDPVRHLSNAGMP